MKRNRSAWWLLSGLLLGLPCLAVPSAEVSPQQGSVELQYQVGGLGELDRYGLRVAADVGAREDVGIGLSFTRLFGTDDRGDAVHTTFGELYLMYQFKERLQPRDLAASALAGYRLVRERGETLSGLQLGVVGDLPLAPRVSAQGRVGFSVFENNNMVDFLLGAALDLGKGLQANLAFQSFSVDSTTEGGVLIGITYRYGVSRTTSGGIYW